MSEGTIKALSQPYNLDAGQVKEAIDYLDYFGYLEEAQPTVLDAEQGIVAFQEIVGVEVDGVLGPQTLRAMQAPRCGLPDYPMMAAEARWRRTHLRWFIQGYVEGLPREQVDDILVTAWSSWSDVAGVTFEKVNSQAVADLIVSVGQGRADGFDGPQGVLAWAYLPQGDDRQLLMKFDLSETWTMTTQQRGILLLNVAAHEFGHMLGLDHSRVKTALMAPYYSPGVSKPQSSDDILRIQSLYGPPISPPSPPSVPTPGEIVIRVRGEVSVDGYRLTKLLI